jgi:prepilin-type N-terminal cleavage/methylation domain-containing protein
MPKNNKGFTLIELLVVIAIVAILAIVVILTLNPAELLKQARDSNRISDLGTIKSALGLYLADISTPNMANNALGYNSCYLSTTSGNGTTTTKCGYFLSGAFTGTTGSTTQTLLRRTDGNGWIPVSFSQISAGTPFNELPIDPVNNANYYYAYAATTTNSAFEIDARLESLKFASSTSNDGGDNAAVYEIGTNTTL